MAISFLGSVLDGSINGNGTNFSITALGLQEGDLVIAAFAVGDGDGVDFDLSPTTSGYTEVADLHADDTEDTDLAVYWKIMGASPDTSFNHPGFGGTNAVNLAIVMGFRGVDQTTPMDVTPTTATGVNSNRPDPPSIDHNNPSGVWTVAVGAFAHTSGQAVTATAPTNYSNGVSVARNDTHDATLAMATRSDPGDPENPGVFTPSIADSTSHSWCAVTLALRPASATPTSGRISWVEKEVPFVLTLGRLAWAEAEVPLVLTSGRISFAEKETPLVLTLGRISVAEVEVPLVLTRGLFSFVELQTPDEPLATPTGGLISVVEFEVPTVLTLGRISQAELETLLAPTRGRFSQAELETLVGATLGRLSQAELEVVAAVSKGRISYVEFFVPDVGVVAGLPEQHLRIGIRIGLD